VPGIANYVFDVMMSSPYKNRGKTSMHKAIMFG